MCCRSDAGLFFRALRGSSPSGSFDRHGSWCSEEKRGLVRSTASGIEARNVALHLRACAQVLQGFAKNTRRNFVVRNHQPVMHPFSVASRCDDPRPAQIRQMARRLRLADPQDFHDVTDANFAIPDKVQHAQACRVREGAEQKVEREAPLHSGHGRTIQHIRLDRYMDAGVSCKHICTCRYDVRGRHDPCRSKPSRL